ncbi:MAG: hypothetical protein ABFD90_02895 [Phycisphaerales bacterium]
MSRSFILFMVIAVIAARASVGGLGGVAQGQTTASTAVVQDNFDDNKMASLWKVFGSSATIKATEANKRLEFITTADANEAVVGYISNKWWIDPNQDFQMKSTLCFDAIGTSSGWVMLGFTPDSDTPVDRHIMFGIGRSKTFKNYWWEGKNDLVTYMDFVGRTVNSVTLYISYDAWNDILYLGDTGYGEENAWQIMENFTSSYWGHVPFYVFLGVTTENLAISSGGAYIDNFALEKGKIGSPYTDPNGPPGDDDPILTDVDATLAIMPSTIGRKTTGDRVTAVITLPKDLTLADWNSADVPTLSPGSIAAGAQAAFTWVDGSVKILASFSKTALLTAVTADGQVELHVVGKLKDGATYAGSCTVTIY